MKFVLLSVFLASTTFAHPHHQKADDKAKPKGAYLIPFESTKVFTNNGNSLRGLATKSKGAQEFEVWHSSIAPGSRTPLHSHSSEETFVILKGSGVVKVGEKAIAFKAPATIIAPAGVPHQVINTGAVPTEQIVIVRIDSEIKSGEKVLNLPWRK